MAASNDSFNHKQPHKSSEEEENLVVTHPRKPKPIPPPLDLSTRHSLDILSEFSPAAPSPRSPLLQNQKHLPFRKRAHSLSAYAVEPNSSNPSTPCSSNARNAYAGVLPTSPRCPRLPVIKQEPGSRGDLRENLEESPAFLTPVTPGPLSPMNFPSSPFFAGGNEGHFLMKMTPCGPLNASSALLSPAASVHSSSQEELTLFRSAKSDDVFYVDDGDFRTKKDLYEERGATVELCEQLQRCDFAKPAARTNERRVQSSSDGPASPGPLSATKRPMNGFMLFAKDHRLHLIQQHPGKDNRAISVLLGEAWKRLPANEKEFYKNEAHARAEEYRLLHPDCWKRKRSKSTS